MTGRSQQQRQFDRYISKGGELVAVPAAVCVELARIGVLEIARKRSDDAETKLVAAAASAVALEYETRFAGFVKPGADWDHMGTSAPESGPMSTTQAAEYLGISVQGVSRAAREGRLPFTRSQVGHHGRLFERADVRAFADERNTRP